MDPEAFADVVAGAIKQAVAPLVARLAVLEATTPRLDSAVLDLDRRSVDTLTRITTVEARPPVPGPPGPSGPAGRDGTDGKDGTPGLQYCGVYVDGRTYERGDLVTYGGSAWHCNEATTARPGDGAKGWTLMVKRGRDGKDGKA